MLILETKSLPMNQTTLKFLIFFSSVSIFFQCSSPQKAFDNRNFEKALKMSSQKIAKGESDLSNYTIAAESSEIIVAIELNKNRVLNDSEQVEDWIKVQDSYYGTLETIGQANIATEGHLDSSYDMLCEAKNEIDFRIIDHFYTDAIDLINESKSSGEKIKARQGHYALNECIKHGGENQYSNLDELLNEAHSLGVIYFTSTGYNPGYSFWYAPVQGGSDQEIDCSLRYNSDWVIYSESESSSSEVNSKVIQTGTETETDTSGMVTSTPIYETVQATINTNTVTVSATIDFHRYVQNVSGQCPLGNYTFTFNESNSYKEINVSGDERALYHIVTEQDGEPAFFRSNLKQAVENKIGDHLN